MVQDAGIARCFCAPYMGLFLCICSVPSQIQFANPWKPAAPMGFAHTWIMFLRPHQQVIRPVLNSYFFFSDYGCIKRALYLVETFSFYTKNYHSLLIMKNKSFLYQLFIFFINWHFKVIFFIFYHQVKQMKLSQTGHFIFQVNMYNFSNDFFTPLQMYSDPYICPNHCQ